jgi:short subunit dehydrogenase-like uncharacterized protein
MAGRIVLFGATGYTGELTARELAGIGERPVLAARDEARVRALADELGGLDWAVADVERPASVRALVSAGDVLISCVGPFMRYGDAAVSACVDAGASYLDSTGETAFIRRVFEVFGPRARSAGCALMTAMGYDWVPGNLAGALALREAGEGATRVAVGYFVVGSSRSAFSGGTMASAAGVMLEPSFAWRGGRLVTERQGARVRSFTVDGHALKGVAAGSSEHFGLPASFPGVRDVEVYLGGLGGSVGAEAMRVGSAALSAVVQVPGARRAVDGLLGRFVRGSSGGPNAEERARLKGLVVAEASDDTGRVLAREVLRGVNPYDFTAGILTWGAHAAANGRVHGVGALGPVEAFGLDALLEGARSAGIERDS